MKTYDVIIIGAGAAGLFAASQLSIRKKSVLIIDMGLHPARKVAISGGGKCNFTNFKADFSHYFGENPRFVISALNQWGARDTLDWVKSHGIDVYEKEPGRFFCKNSANDIVNALVNDANGVEIKYDTSIIDVDNFDGVFIVKTNHGNFSSQSIIVASGGVSYPHIGVSNIGHIIAKKFGHKIVPSRPALCAIKTKSFSDDLSGISLPVEIIMGKNKIQDDLLFTHFGIGGPAAYRATLFNSLTMAINFAPNINMFEYLKNAKQQSGKKSLVNIISEILPKNLARFLCNDTRNIADIRDAELKEIANKINSFAISDARPIGLQSAEVMAGGISTDKISSKTMESQICQGLYFAGEVIDIAGDLGGFNLQWAFSSGYVAGKHA